MDGLEILNLQAHGGMAEVYRARGRGADGIEYFYAVKRMLPEYTNDLEVRQMFAEESRIASLLIHPNIVRVYDLVSNEKNELFIVMEFLEGKDLSEVIQEFQTRGQTLPIWFSVHVALEVCRALDYVAAKAVDDQGRLLGLIHRDVSPHNIFLCTDGQVKLTDFGVAKIKESRTLTQKGMTKGKLGYMSPEQLQGHKLDTRSDIYNIGILLYEMIVGKPLFAGNTAAEVVLAMSRGIVPALPASLRVPAELDQIMRRALDRMPLRRPESAASLVRELEAVARRYQLTAEPAHIAHHLRSLFVPDARPAAADQRATPRMKLRSMSTAAVPPGSAGTAGVAGMAASRAPSPPLSPTDDDAPTVALSVAAAGQGPARAGAPGVLDDNSLTAAVPAAALGPEHDDTPTLPSQNAGFEAAAGVAGVAGARGNARPLPRRSAGQGAVPDNEGGKELPSARPSTKRAEHPHQGERVVPERAPSVLVGGHHLGGRKNVVPLAPPRKR